jgi:hypothetical protein
MGMKANFLCAERAKERREEGAGERVYYLLAESET